MYTFLVSPSAVISIFLFVLLGFDVGFFLFFRRIQLIHVGLPWGMTLFYVSSLLLIAEYSDNSFGCWYLHAQELLSYDYVEFVHETFAENREIWMIYINHIKSESFYSGVVKISERYRKRYFSDWLDWFSFETLQWVFWWM
jgi:hypothetical protein